MNDSEAGDRRTLQENIESSMLKICVSSFRKNCALVYSNPDMDLADMSREKVMAVWAGLILPVTSLALCHQHHPFLEEVKRINQAEGENSQFSALLAFICWVFEKEESSHKRVTGWSPEKVDKETKDTISLDRIYGLAKGVSYFHGLAVALPEAGDFHNLQKLFDKVVPVSFNFLNSVLNELVPTFILSFGGKDRDALWTRIQQEWVKD